MATEPNPPATDRHGNHAGQWGLAALFLGGVTLILFPLLVSLFLALLIGAWEVNAVELRHVEFAVIGLWVVVYGQMGAKVMTAADLMNLSIGGLLSKQRSSKM